MTGRAVKLGSRSFVGGIQLGLPLNPRPGPDWPSRCNSRKRLPDPAQPQTQQKLKEPCRHFVFSYPAISIHGAGIHGFRRALVEHYVRELNEQEDRVESLRHEIIEMQQKRDAAQSTLNGMVEALQMEVTL
jgi:hypothetical protein